MGRILKSVLKTNKPESNWDRSDLMIDHPRTRSGRLKRKNHTNYKGKHDKRSRRHLDALDHCVDQRNYRKYLADLWVSGK